MTLQLALATLIAGPLIAAVFLWLEARSAHRWDAPGPRLAPDPDAGELHAAWDRPVVYDDDGSEW